MRLANRIQDSHARTWTRVQGQDRGFLGLETVRYPLSRTWSDATEFLANLRNGTFVPEMSFRLQFAQEWHEDSLLDHSAKPGGSAQRVLEADMSGATSER